MITKQNVADKAGVSWRTVHRVINSPGLVEQTTREKVEAAILELGYVEANTGRPQPEVPLLHAINLRVDDRTRDLLAERGRQLTEKHGPRARGWDAHIVRLALDWALDPPEDVESMPEDFTGSVDRV